MPAILVDLCPDPFPMRRRSQRLGQQSAGSPVATVSINSSPYFSAPRSRPDKTKSDSDRPEHSSEEWRPTDSQSETSLEDFVQQPIRMNTTANRSSVGGMSTGSRRRQCPGKRTTKKRPSAQLESPCHKLSDSDGEQRESSSEEFTSIKSERFEGRNAGELLLFSQFRPRSTRRRIYRKPSLQQTSEDNGQATDSAEDDEWEEVDDKVVGEVDFMQTLLAAKSEMPNVSSVDCEPAALTVSVPTCASSKKSSNKNPVQAERQARLRKLKEEAYSMHLTHVLSFLTHARWLNLLCDNKLYRALGLSLLDRVDSAMDSSGCFLPPTMWSLDILHACMVAIMTRYCVADGSNKDASHRSALLVKRITDGCASPRDCLILLVSALRALDLDVRLVVGLTPLALKPTESNHEVQPSPEAVENKMNKHTGKKKKNRRIISSSSEDFDFVPSQSRIGGIQPVIHTFAEVFIAKENRWVFADMTPPLGRLDEPRIDSSMLYVVGLTTCCSSSPDTRPYVDRNPVDLASRYDPKWCDESRYHRLSADKWLQLLSYMRPYFNLDAALRGAGLVSRENDLITVKRDVDDENRIRSLLLSKPLPARVQDFKNHPLYALQRHLLKFEVIHPPDAIPLGFLRNEPVYSRDCVHLCHTRESWLKEAKVVRPHEKPAKTVKARLSMKRKLLHGSDPTPPTVDIYGSWQVEDYQPPVAQDGVVPRNEHGTIDLFKPSMLPIGCAHLCLTGIQHVAKKLGVDCAPAVIGWTFHGAGWAVPQVHGYVVCKENVSTLVDAWRATRMNAAKAAAQERSERAIENWKRLVRGLFLWHRVKAQFALAAMHEKPKSEIKVTMPAKKRRSKKPDDKLKQEESGVAEPVPTTVTIGSVELGSVTGQLGSTSGWQRLGSSAETQSLPLISIKEEPSNEKRRRPVATKGPPKRVSAQKKRKTKVVESTSEESDDPATYSSTDTTEEEGF
ncbi:xeroderma pigmentosum group C-complementing protein [Clonorchis sinensis]|uniref:Xeroderma pigmentosum group C-complementing protein n=1 Tax=Clonorchis sinensis TaxID=79923 RepID=H2KSH9_CLOSI|nr:xeroderma pigmentosum group C-complementing protein [Clonorchis sinensis]